MNVTFLVVLILFLFESGQLTSCVFKFEVEWVPLLPHEYITLYRVLQGLQEIDWPGLGAVSLHCVGVARHAWQHGTRRAV